MPDVKTLYDEDFLEWSKEQAEALRAAERGGPNLTLDWGNLAEEIEGLGSSEKRELRSRIQRIIRHLLKLEYSTATEPRRSWDDSVDDARGEIDLLLKYSPSLAREIPSIISEEFVRGSRRALRDLEKYCELDPTAATRIRATTYTTEQILGDWFPPEPQA